MPILRLTGAERRRLRALAHHKKVIVTLGQRGLTPRVIAETDAALTHHELIKLRLPDGPRAVRQHLITRVCEATGAAPVQLIGRVAVLYRPAEPPRIRLAPIAPRARQGNPDGISGSAAGYGPAQPNTLADSNTPGAKAAPPARRRRLRTKSNKRGL